jgi:hypothetical protein
MEYTGKGFLVKEMGKGSDEDPEPIGNSMRSWEKIVMMTAC